MGFDTPNQGDNVLESGDVDHQQTTNRTHSGDDISPTSVSSDSGQTKVTNEDVVWAGHPDFTTLQDTLDFAQSNDYWTIVVPSNTTFGPINPHQGQIIRGLGSPNSSSSRPLIDGGTTDNAVNLGPNAASRVSLINLAIFTESGAGNNFHCVYDGGGPHELVTVQDCQIAASDANAVYQQSGNNSRWTVTGCDCANGGNIDGDAVNLQGDDNVVTGNTQLSGASVTDGGTNNVIANNS